MRPLALRWRISLCAVVTLVATVAVMSVLVYFELRGLFIQHIDESLLVVARGAAAVMDDAPDASEPAEMLAMMGVTKSNYTCVYRVWLDGEDRDLYATDKPEDVGRRLREAIGAQRPPEFGGYLFFGEGPGPRGYRAVWLRTKTFRGPTNIVVAQFGHFKDREIRTFLAVVAASAGGIIILAVIATLVVVTWALRPVERTAREIRSVTAQNVGDVVIDQHRVPPELEPFVVAVKEMMGRLGRAFASQKQLIANASHELRTPLALAKSTLQAARYRDRDVATYKKMADEALLDLSRMEHLIEEMLTLARLDEVAGVSNPTVVDLSLLLPSVVERFAATPGFDRKRLVCRTLSAKVLGNEGQLTRLVLNLLDNAAKYGPEKGRISLAMAESQGFVSVTVHDEGGGIPSADIPTLFDRFVRLDRSRAKATGGAGLGLSICQEIASHHGGTITIASEPKSGTTVTLRLPTCNGRQDPSDQ